MYLKYVQRALEKVLAGIIMPVGSALDTTSGLEPLSQHLTKKYWQFQNDESPKIRMVIVNTIRTS